MSRQQRSEKVVATIAHRFVDATHEQLGVAPAELWRLLGYANPSTVHAMRRGKALPDFVRIAEHNARLCDAKGRTLNLHWVITGEGVPMLNRGQKAARPITRSEQLDNDIIIKLRGLKLAQKTALVKFLTEFSD